MKALARIYLYRKFDFFLLSSRFCLHFLDFRFISLHIQFCKSDNKKCLFQQAFWAFPFERMKLLYVQRACWKRGKNVIINREIFLNKAALWYIKGIHGIDRKGFYQILHVLKCATRFTLSRKLILTILICLQNEMLNGLSRKSVSLLRTRGKLSRAFSFQKFPRHCLHILNEMEIQES